MEKGQTKGGNRSRLTSLHFVLKRKELSVAFALISGSAAADIANHRPPLNFSTDKISHC